MSSKGRKIAKNIGKSIRKKFDTDSQTDDLQQRMSEHGNSALSSEMRSSQSSGHSTAMAKSTSLSTISNSNEIGDPVLIDHTQIVALTQDVKNFSDTLAKMKLLFIEGLEPGEDASAVMQEALGEVLAVLKVALERYSELQRPEIFSAAKVLIAQIKAHESRELHLEEDELQLYLDNIDQLALAFSRSVSEYLTGDIVGQQQITVESPKVKSCDNLVKAAYNEEQPSDRQEQKKATPAELDGILLGLDAGLDLAQQRAKIWSRYTRDIITYIEKKSQLEMEYAKNLARIAHCMEPVLKSDGFLPLQSVFCTALTQDGEFASNLQTSQALLHTTKFVEPLMARRNEHDRVRKAVKEMWDREVRRMQETVNNLRKAQSLYISRQQELERARDTLQKAEGDKVEKRKKVEEDAMHKAAEAETTYKACVAEANHRQRAIEKTKAELLAKIREQIFLCDQVIKTVAVDYFNILYTVWSPIPVQYQTLCESSRMYEVGYHYAEFIKNLPSSASKPSRTEDFIFEPYTPGQKAGEGRKISLHSNGSSGEHVPSNEGSPVSSPRRDKYRIPVKAWGQNSASAPAGGSDTDSCSGSNRSHDSSPSSSPHDILRRQIVSSQSMEELVEEETDAPPTSAQQRRNPPLKRTVTVGDDSLDLPDIRGSRRNTTFGVDFQEQVDRYKMEVPPIITRCLAEIERRGVAIKGIYRVSGVKSKVENLCHRFDINPELVDIEEVHPNIISNVLKQYLRQLPEPLLTFRLYSDFIHLAKENMAGALTGQKLVERMVSLAHKLPPSNFRTCAILMHHLHRVADEKDLNQMSSSNLGIVFGPTLLRPLEGNMSLASLVDTPHQTRAIELLITHAVDVFGPGDEYLVIPDETPVEELDESEEALGHSEPCSTEPSPEKSPTRLATQDFFTADNTRPIATLVTANTAMTTSTASALALIPSTVSTAAAVAASHYLEDSIPMVSDVASSSVPSLEPSAADFSLPGSASPETCDNFMPVKPVRSLADDPSRVSLDSEDSSLSFLDDDDDDDDDLADTLLPDQSHAACPKPHAPLLTPQCIADSSKKAPAKEMSAGDSPEARKDKVAAGTLSAPGFPLPSTVQSSGPSGSPGAGTLPNLAPSSFRAPLADMEPAPDSVLPRTLISLATLDPSVRSTTIATSPTVRPVKAATIRATAIASPEGFSGAVVAVAQPSLAFSRPAVESSSYTPPSSPSASSIDGRLSPSKGDNRVERIKQEQRRLLSAIKSDPKLGIGECKPSDLDPGSPDEPFTSSVLREPSLPVQSPSSVVSNQSASALLGIEFGGALNSRTVESKSSAAADMDNCQSVDNQSSLQVVEEETVRGRVEEDKPVKDEVDGGKLVGSARNQRTPQMAPPSAHSSPHSASNQLTGGRVRPASVSSITPAVPFSLHNSSSVVNARTTANRSSAPSTATSSTVRRHAASHPAGGTVNRSPSGSAPHSTGTALSRSSSSSSGGSPRRVMSAGSPRQGSDTSHLPTADSSAARVRHLSGDKKTGGQRKASSSESGQSRSAVTVTRHGSGAGRLCQIAGASASKTSASLLANAGTSSRSTGAKTAARSLTCTGARSSTPPSGSVARLASSSSLAVAPASLPSAAATFPPETSVVLVKTKDESILLDTSVVSACDVSVPSVSGHALLATQLNAKKQLAGGASISSSSSSAKEISADRTPRFV